MACYHVCTCCRGKNTTAASVPFLKEPLVFKNLFRPLAGWIRTEVRTALKRSVQRKIHEGDTFAQNLAKEIYPGQSKETTSFRMYCDGISCVLRQYWDTLYHRLSQVRGCLACCDESNLRKLFLLKFQ